MDGPAPQYRCEACGASHLVHALARDKWGDQCCPACQSLRLTLQRSKMSGVLAVYFLFNVF